MRMAGTHLGCWRAAGAAALLLVAGCTFTTIESEQVTKPKETYTTVVLGDIAVPDEAPQAYVPLFRQGFTREAQALKFAVVDSPKGAPPPSSIVLSGRLTDFDKGSQVARLLVGFGAGAARVRGDFEIRDAKGVVLAKFEAGKSYSGGTGLGGIDMMGMGRLMEKFGQETARTVWRWSKGESLDVGATPPPVKSP
jgi:hypothetical protein